MTKSEALSIFNIPENSEPDEMMDHFQQLAYEIYAPLFTSELIPLILQSKIQKLMHLNEGWIAMGLTPQRSVIEPKKFDFHGSASQNLSNYFKYTGELRSSLSKASGIEDRIQILRQMISLRLHWSEWFIHEFRTTMKDAVVVEQISLSAPTNFEVLARIMQLAADELNSQELFVLTHEFHRSVRIVESYGRAES